MARYPFAPELLDALPEPLAERLRALEDELLQKICERLCAGGKLNEVTVQAMRSLRAHGISLEEIENAIREQTGAGRDELNRLFDEVEARNRDYYGGI